ncbi:NADP-dependent malic enzyme [Drosophila serrata]|uniref:NADP-dependent malic enzyme n=1 Tax=Drosophila serrata TaxID=7274 RepID=UPI000A1D06F0|nr:NADP-dependent malic enzyme [Drosophila serrata]
MSFFRTFNWGLNRLTTMAQTPQRTHQPNLEQYQKREGSTHDTIRLPLNIVFSAKYNKALAFTLEERQRLNIHGLLPASVRTCRDQMYAIETNFHSFETNVEKYRYLRTMRQSNERMYFQFVSDHIALVLPIIYTPTVGVACTIYGMLYREITGLYITKHDRGHMSQVLSNWPKCREISAICVTDGERILGLGDLGANGMGISIGKMDLYTSLAGIPPCKLLPICLDVGTENPVLHQDPLYIGLREKRLKGVEYDAFIDEFMQSVVETFGSQTLIHFEDFATPNAFKFLKKYQNCYCKFNDDIQGTAAVGVAGLLGIQRMTKVPLQDHVILFVGAGSAAMGICGLLQKELMSRGLSEKDTAKNIYITDQDGLITKEKKNLSADLQAFAKDMEPIKSLEELVDKIKPSIILGATAAAGIFNEKIIRTMAAAHDRPGIFAFSNPTNKSECTAEQAYKFSDGRAIFSAGSPFPPVEFNGKRLTPGQANNCLAFPGVVLGVLTGLPQTIPDEIFLLAAHELSKFPSDEELESGNIYPLVEKAKDVAFKIGYEVAKYIFDNGLSQRCPPPDDLCELLLKNTYELEHGSSLAETWKYPNVKPNPCPDDQKPPEKKPLEKKPLEKKSPEKPQEKKK